MQICRKTPPGYWCW